MSISANGVRTDYANSPMQSLSQQNETNASAVPVADHQAKQETPVVAENNSGQQKQATDAETIQNKLKQVNKVLDDLNQKFEYRLVREKGMDVLQLYDKDNKKVLYQNPPEGILNVADKLQQAVGLVIDLKR